MRHLARMFRVHVAGALSLEDAGRRSWAALLGLTWRDWPRRQAATAGLLLLLVYLALLSSSCGTREPMPDTPLIVAIKEHDRAAVKREADKLFEHELDPKGTQLEAAMHVAIDCWFTDAAMALVHHGVNTDEALRYAKATGRREIHNKIARLLNDPKRYPLM